MARHLKPLDWKRVEELLEAGCLGTEIAAVFNMHPDTFYRRVQEEYGVGFTEFSTEKNETGNAYLREAQYLKAIDKDNTMLIWLGKNRLKQSEKREITFDAESKGEVLAAMQRMGKEISQKPSDAPQS